MANLSVLYVHPEKYIVQANQPKLYRTKLPISMCFHRGTNEKVIILSQAPK